MPAKFSSLVRTVAPATEPLTLAQVRTQLKLEDTDTDQDAHLTLLLAVAREWVEDFLGRSIITQTWQAKYSGWPTDRKFVLPRMPIASLTSVKYYDTTNTLVTLTVTTDYLLETSTGEFILTDAFGFPGLSEDRVNAIEVVFVAGYGDAAAVPSRIKQAILLAIANWYENRTPVIPGGAIKVPMSCEYLLKQLRVRPV